MDKQIVDVEKLMDKYGYMDDAELGRVPVIVDDMTTLEKEAVDKYVDNLLKVLHDDLVPEENQESIVEAVKPKTPTQRMVYEEGDIEFE